MDKNILNNYMDACAFIKETEAEIKKLEKNKKMVQDKVQGSNLEFPYERRSVNISGTIETYGNADALRRERELLELQRKEAEELKEKVEEWMKTIPFRMQRIIRYRIFNELTWKEIATLMGKKCTENSVKQEFCRFMQKK